MISMYELSAEQARLTSEIATAAEENDGVVPDELMEQLLACDGDATQKVENCVKAVKILEGENMVIDGQIAALETEIARLEKRKNATDNAVKRLENRVIEFMRSVGKEKVKTALFTVYPKTAVSVNIIDESKLPIEFKRQTVKVEYKPDKKLIKEYIESGKNISGAELVTNTYLRIK